MFKVVDNHILMRLPWLQAWNNETATSPLGGKLGIADASEQEVYQANGWI